MKFLCRNCKAKYQIADDKVAGRTLRMTCQQCGEAIVVRGAGRATAQASRPISQPLAPMAIGSSPLPSALGADFQRQVSIAPATPVARNADEWHVAINDTPVGPMRREEVARKIAMGAIDRESLAWREGMDDWLPVRHIPELAMLFEVRAPIPPPPPPAAIMAPPPQVQMPAARVEMSPIGGRQVMALEDYAPAPEPVVSTTMTIEPVQTSERRSEGGGKPLGWAPMFALVSGGAFILAVGLVLGARVLPTQPAPAGAPAAQTTATPAPVVAAPTPAPTPADEEPHGSVIELDMQDIAGEASGTRRPTSSGQATTTTDKGKGKELTQEQKDMLARMGGGGVDTGLAGGLRSQGEGSRNSGGGSGSLTADQLKEVVMRGRKNLQRCYETALRGAGSTETVKMDVAIQVSPNGNVTSVDVTGKGPGDMNTCITKTVRTWRFPSSGETTATRFPVVFQPGS